MEIVFIFLIGYLPAYIFEKMFYNFPTYSNGKSEPGVLSFIGLFASMFLYVPYMIIHESSTSLFNIYPIYSVVFLFIPIFILYFVLLYFCNKKYDEKYLIPEAETSSFYKLLLVLVVSLLAFTFSIYTCCFLNYSFAKEFSYRYVQVKEIRKEYHSTKNGHYYIYYAVLKKTLMDTTEITLGRKNPVMFYKNSWLKIQVYEGAFGIPFAKTDNISFIDEKNVPKELIADNEELKRILKPKTLDKNLPMNGY